MVNCAIDLNHGLNTTVTNVNNPTDLNMVDSVNVNNPTYFNMVDSMNVNNDDLL